MRFFKKKYRVYFQKSLKVLNVDGKRIIEHELEQPVENYPIEPVIGDLVTMLAPKSPMDAMGRFFTLGNFPVEWRGLGKIKSRTVIVGDNQNALEARHRYDFIVTLEPLIVKISGTNFNEVDIEEISDIWWDFNQHIKKDGFTLIQEGDFYDFWDSWVEEFTKQKLHPFHKD